MGMNGPGIRDFEDGNCLFFIYANQGLKINLDYQQAINQRCVIFEFEKS